MQHLVKIETPDWTTPLAFIENFIYYAQRESYPSHSSAKLSDWLPPSSSSEGQFEEFTSLRRTNSLDKFGQSEQNDGGGHTVEILATFHISMRFFQRPVLSDSNRYIYTLGKCVADPKSHIEKLRLLRIDLLKLQITSYLSKDFKYLLFTMPGLYCGNRQRDSADEASSQLFLCFNYTADCLCPRALSEANEDFPDEISPPFKSVCLPTGTGDIVDCSCLFRVVLDEATRSFALIPVPVPLPPLKPTRIVWARGAGKVRCAEIPDNARLLPVILPPSESNSDEMCLFSLNTNAQAHIYDGQCWHKCRAEEDPANMGGMEMHDFQKEFSNDADADPIDNKYLFAANNRVFLIVAPKLFHQYSEHYGKLIEIFVNPTTHSFRIKVLCNSVKFSSIKSVACSGNRFAVSNFYGWKGIKQSLPEPAPCIGPQKGCVQFLVGPDE